MDREIESSTYIPSTHEGSFTSSTENRHFSSGVETNLSRGGEGTEPYLFPTGYITCNKHKNIWMYSYDGEEKRGEVWGREELNL